MEGPGALQPPSSDSIALRRVFLWLWTLGWCCGILVFDTAAIGRIVRNAQAASFPSTPAVITESSVTSKPAGKGNTNWSAHITYTYTVNNVGYTSSSVRRCGGWSLDQSRAAAQVARFFVGSHVSAYYNPASPGDSVLLPGADGDDVAFLYFVVPFNVAAVIGVLAVIGLAKVGPLAERPLGVQSRDDGETLRLRLSVYRPILTPLITIAAGCGLGGIYGEFMSTGTVPMGWALLYGAVVVAFAVGAYIFHRKTVRSGRYDLNLDRRAYTVAFPPGVDAIGGRRVSFADVQSVSFVNGSLGRKGRRYVTWKVQITVADDGIARTLVEGGDYRGLEALARKLRSELALEGG